MTLLRRCLGMMLALTSCATPTEPLPAGAVPFTPDKAVWQRWWGQVESCSGRRGDYGAVEWLLVPDVAFFLWRGFEVRGLWVSDGNRIILADRATRNGAIVRHEMLHALLRVDGHPEEFFQLRCRDVVD